MVIMCLSILPFFIAISIYYPSNHKWNVPEVSQSTSRLYIWVKSSPINNVFFFNFVHMIQLCLKLCSSIFIVKYTMTIRP